MRFKFFAILLVAGLMSANLYSQKDAGTSIKTSNDSLSYSLGYNMGTFTKSNVDRDSININYDILMMGLNDA
jgi:hypothetical protein